MNYNSFNFRQAEEILNSKKEIFDEIKATIDGMLFTPLQKGDHDKIIQAFKSKGWTNEEKISQDLRKEWRYDAYKGRVAVEVDTKSGCYRSFLKFVLGYNLGKIDVGVVIVYNMPDTESHHGRRFWVTRKELEDLKTIIPAPIFLIGIHP